MNTAWIFEQLDIISSIGESVEGGQNRLAFSENDMKAREFLKHLINQIGLYKTQALKNIIENINPYIKIICKNIMLNSHNIINEVSGFDVILECFDNAETKVMLMEKCIKELPSSFIIGASGVAGYFDTDIIKIKKLGSNCIVVGDFENEAGFFKGLMAPRVTACAAVQANETIKYLLKDI